MERKIGGKEMRNEATVWLAEYIKNQSLSADFISVELNIPKEKLILGTEEHLNADECLRLCAYLQIDPQIIPISQDGI